MDKKPWYEKVNVWIAIIAGIFTILVSILTIISWVNSNYSNKITTETSSTENNKNKEEIKVFVPDYEPGKENVINDSTYQNNMGCFSKQDKMYYFATSKGIYKMNSELKKCQLVIKDEYARYLNVLGDWIYYSTESGIYKIKTDGSEKTSVVQLEGYPLDMEIQYENLYYIKSSDHKLYCNNHNGESEKCIYDKPVTEFICIDAYIYFVQAERIDDESGTHYRSLSLNSMFYDGGERYTLFENMYDNNGVLVNDTPQDLCEFGDYIVCSNYFGLFLIDKLTGERKQINNKGGYGLCVLNDFAYYSTPEPNINGFLTKVSLDSFETETIARPFDDNSQLRYIYPVEDKIILTLDCETWYYLDSDNELNRITFDIQ